MPRRDGTGPLGTGQKMACGSGKGRRHSQAKSHRAVPRTALTFAGGRNCGSEAGLRMGHKWGLVKEAHSGFKLTTGSQINLEADTVNDHPGMKRGGRNYRLVVSHHKNNNECRN